MYSEKVNFDKFYTRSEIVSECVALLELEKYKSIIEPSAGNGAFSRNIENCIAYDIEPESDGIIQADYIKLDLNYKKGRLIIGNPPYGSRLNLAKAFCNKSFEISDYVAFILPISQLNNTQTIYKFDLIYSEDLGKQNYSGVDVHCCFNIYKRPNNGRLNEIQRFRDSEIIEIREVIVNNNPKRNRELGSFEYDFAICAWGASIGKQCDDGDYAKTFFIKIKDSLNFTYYKELILNADWKTLYPMTNTPNLLQWQVYKYVQDNRK